MEELKFQAETTQLLNLMIHSLYTNKDIFLRELISNASDTLDRSRFEALTNPELLAGDDRYEIRLEVDKQARTLSISDTGIGRTQSARQKAPVRSLIAWPGRGHSNPEGGL